MTEADALNALSARADKLAGEDELAGAVLIAKDDRVLFSHAYELADRTSIETVYHVCSFLPLIGLLAWFLPEVEGARRTIPAK